MLISEAAAIVVTSIRRSPDSDATAIGIVCVLLSIKNAIGIMYSFQVQMKKKTSITDSVGLEIGYTILVKIVHLFAPSMVAASRIAEGNVPYTLESK